MRNRAALDLCTLGPAPLERRLYAASAAGFGAIGIAQAELDTPEERGRQELRLSELAVADLSGVVGWMEPGRSARTLALLQAESAFAAAAEVGAGLVIAWPSDEPVEMLAAEGYFADLCRAAVPFGVRVGLEFVGHSKTVATLDVAWQIVAGAEAANGGLVIDAFHFHVGGSRVEMIDELPADSILLVQVSDAPDLPRSEVDDRHRLYPGAGAIELEPLLAAVRAKGYSGYYSLELHNEDYWAEDPVVVAAEGFRSMRRLDLV